MRKVEGVMIDTETQELIIGEDSDIISDSTYNFNTLFELLVNNNSVYAMIDGEARALKFEYVKGIVCNNSNCECKVLAKAGNKNSIIEIKVTDNTITHSRIYYTLKGETQFSMIYYKTDTSELRNGCLCISDNDELCQLISESHSITSKRLALVKLPDFARKRIYRLQWGGGVYVLCHANDNEMVNFCKRFSNTTIQFVYDDLCVDTSLTGDITLKFKFKYKITEIYRIDENGFIKEHKRNLEDNLGTFAIIPV